MAKSDDSGFAVEARKTSTTIGETGTADRSDNTYQLGAVIGGQFVPFVTKSAGYIDHLVSNAQAAADANALGTSDGDEG